MTLAPHPLACAPAAPHPPITTQGIDTFKLAPGFTPSATSQMLLLSAYKGWGVSASNLAIVPSAPLPATFTLPDLAGRSAF